MLTGIARTTVLVEDQQAALDWYRAVLGFEVLHDEQREGVRLLHIGLPGQPDVGLWLLPVTEQSAGRVGLQTGGEPLLVLRTDGLGTVMTRLEGHEVEVWNVHEDERGRSLHLRDVAGNVVMVSESV